MGADECSPGGIGDVTVFAIPDPTSSQPPGGVLFFVQYTGTSVNPGDVEDVFLAIITLTDGTIVQAEYTISAEDLPSWFIQGDRGTITAWGKTIKVHGSTPSRPDDPTQYAAMRSTDDSITEETVEGNIYGDEHEVYAEVAMAIRGEAEAPVSTEDALEVSRVLEAIRVSSDGNRVVSM